MKSRMSMSMAVVLVLAVLTVTAASVSPAAAMEPAPGWLLRAVSIPTAFSASDEEDKYLLLLTNVGSAPSDGSPITIKGTLGRGLVLKNVNDFTDEWECTLEGESSFTCERSGTVGSLEQADELRVKFQVGVGVAPDTPVTSTFTVSGGGAATSSTNISTVLEPSAPTLFGVQDVFSFPADANGLLDTQAGGHPYSLTEAFDFSNSLSEDVHGAGQEDLPIGDVKDVVVDLPVGFSGNPQAVPECPQSALIRNEGAEGFHESNCPAASQVGTIDLLAHGRFIQDDNAYFGEGEPIPVFNMVPEQGHPAEFGTSYAGFPLMMYPSVVGSGANAHLRVTVPGVPGAEQVHFEGAQLTLFGDPATHDDGATAPAAFLTNPSSCSGEPLTTTVFGDSWEEPGARNANGSPALSEAAGEPTGPGWVSGVTTTPVSTGCAALHFNPTIAVRPESTQADTPTGVGVDLKIPQNSDPTGLATADLKEVTVALPAGMSVSPPSADGLQACSDAQFDASSHEPAICPQASQVGTVTATTPVLAQPLEGQVFVATPECSPCSSADAQDGRMLRLFMQLEGPGLVLKFPGTVSVDPGTGRLTATFKGLIQQPVSNVQVQMKGGARAPLANSQTCGTATTTSELVPWSFPETPAGMPSSSFTVDWNGDGGACPGVSPFSPGFGAGTVTPLAGGFSAFTLTFSRKDREQGLSSIAVTMPPGLLGALKGVTLCGEPQAALGTCGSASQIGTTQVAVGPGSHPLWKEGKVFLTGPYEGQPFGLSVVVPAVAGPFNLGTVIVRASIYVDPNTAALTVSSDPFPTILDGVPLRVQTVNVSIDREGFTFNPTNCDQQQITATIASTQGASADVSNTFEVGGCAALPFKPSFSASTGGRTSRLEGASLTVKVTQKAGEADIHKVDLQLPAALPAQLKTLQKACTEAQFNADPAGCPAASVIGMATAVTPVLSVPLTGPAYLVSHGGAAYPDVEFVLQANERGGMVQIVLDGKTAIKNGIVYSNFETVPDAPISSFETVLPEGPHAALTANGKDLCVSGKKKTVTVRGRTTVRVHGHVRHITKKIKRTVATPASLVMPTTIVGQNGAVVEQDTPLAITGCAKPKATKSARGR